MFYKRLANAKTENELDALQIEMIDRFGILPEALKRLFVILAQAAVQSHECKQSKLVGKKASLSSPNPIIDPLRNSTVSPGRQ